MKVDLKHYDNSQYRPGAHVLLRCIWFSVNALFFDSWLHLGSKFKRTVLRLFGAQIGARTVIKPRVNIKYPWRLVVGHDVWIGEGAWIDNLGNVQIGSNACISQGARLLTGNHDYKDPAFGLIIGEIHIGEGAWIGAHTVVGPAVTVGSHAVVTVGSVLTADAEARGIYHGNPATKLRTREIRSAERT